MVAPFPILRNVHMAIRILNKQDSHNKVWVPEKTKNVKCSRIATYCQKTRKISKASTRHIPSIQYGPCYNAQEIMINIQKVRQHFL